MKTILRVEKEEGEEGENKEPYLLNICEARIKTIIYNHQKQNKHGERIN